MPFRPGLFAPSRRPRREANQPRTLWKGSTQALDSSPGTVRRRGSRAVARGPWLESSCQQGSETVGRALQIATLSSDLLPVD